MRTSSPGRRASGAAPRGSNPADSTARETPRDRRTGALRGTLRAATFALAGVAGAGFVALATTPAAHAAPFVEVTYDLGDSSAVSSVPLIGVTTEVPPHGTISGTQTIRYTGGSGSYTGTAGTGPTLATGSVELLSFKLTVHATVGTDTYTRYGGKTFTVLNTADLYFEFLNVATGPTKGQRLSGGTVTPLGASGLFQVSGYLHCFQLCGAFPIPASTRTPLKPRKFTAPLPVLAGAVNSQHTVSGTATGVTFNLSPEAGNVGIEVTGTTFVVGREIRRTAVPEPRTLPLLAGGLVGLSLAAAAWRRRRAGPEVRGHDT